MCYFIPILTKINKTRNPKKTESENFEQKSFNTYQGSRKNKKDMTPENHILGFMH